MMHLFIRAYFDQYGNFTKITDTVAGRKIKEVAADSHISVTEYCYRALGYASDGIYTAEERMKRRAAAVDEKSVGYLNLFPDKKIKKSLLKTNDIRPQFVKKPTGFSESYRDVVEAVANFIEHTEMIALENKEKGNLSPLRELFFDLKLTKNQDELEMLIINYIQLVKLLLSRAIVVENIEQSYVAAGKICLAHDVSNVEELAYHVCQHVGRRAITMPAEQYYFVTGNMAYYQLAEQKSGIYPQMVDIATAHSMTIQQLIQYLGFSYVNQFEIYRITGYFMYEITGSRYLCIDPLNPDIRLEISYADLYRKYEPGGGLQLCKI